MAIFAPTRSSRIYWMSEACRKGTRARREISRAVRASGCKNILCIDPLSKKPHNNYLRRFLHALKLMDLKRMPPGYAKYLGNVKRSLKTGDSPVFVITNSPIRVPLWLISLGSKRDFILVKHKSSENPTPVLSELTRRASWGTFARALKGLGVRKMVIYGETSADHFARACAVLSDHFQVGIDGERVFPHCKDES